MILLLYRTNRGDDTRAGKVQAVNLRDSGLVAYGPDYRKAKTTLSAGQGAFDPTELGKRRFGLIDVKIVEKARSKKFSYSHYRSH